MENIIFLPIWASCLFFVACLIVIGCFYAEEVKNFFVKRAPKDNDEKRLCRKYKIIELFIFVGFILLIILGVTEAYLKWDVSNDVYFGAVSLVYVCVVGFIFILCMNDRKYSNNENFIDVLRFSNVPTLIYIGVLLFMTSILSLIIYVILLILLGWLYFYNQTKMEKLEDKKSDSEE